MNMSFCTWAECPTYGRPFLPYGHVHRSILLSTIPKMSIPNNGRQPMICFFFDLKFHRTVMKQPALIQTRKSRKMAKNHQKRLFLDPKTVFLTWKHKNPQKPHPKRRSRGILRAFRICFGIWVLRRRPTPAWFRVQKWLFSSLLTDFIILTRYSGHFWPEMPCFSRFLLFTGFDGTFNWLKKPNSADFSDIKKYWPISTWILKCLMPRISKCLMPHTPLLCITVHRFHQVVFLTKVIFLA